jgi:hypothetical protein
MVGLGATGIAVSQSRKSLSIIARLPDELAPEVSLTDTFRNHGDSDPRFPLQGGLLAGLGHDYHLEIHWREGGRRMVMSLAPGSSSISQSPLPMPLPAMEIHATPAKRGLIAKLFSLTDFSFEFREVSRRTYLAPVPVTLDKRPCDFSTGFALHFYPALEFRGVRATGGPRLQLLPSVTRGLARPGLRANDHYQPLGSGGYAFLLSLGWSEENPRISTAGWIRDGVLVHEEPLFPEASPLHLTLFLPAEGLPTDATGMALRQSKERAFRLREARLWALTSLKTHFPPTPSVPSGQCSDGVARRIQTEVQARMSEALEGCDYTRSEARQFQDAIEAHLQLQEPPQATDQAELALPSSLSQQELREQASIARWGRFLSYAPPLAPGVYERYQSQEPTKPTQVRQFFGEVYVALPNRG